MSKFWLKEARRKHKEREKERLLKESEEEKRRAEKKTEEVKTKVKPKIKKTAKARLPSRFPDVDYHDQDANPAYAQAVRKAFDEVVANHRELLSTGVTEAFYIAKRDGFPTANASVALAARVAGKQVLACGFTEEEAHFHTILGIHLFRKLREHNGDRFLPFNDAMVWYGQPQENMIQVKMLSMMPIKHEGGIAYYSRREPKALLDGQLRIVAFTNHAAERICERAVHDWRTYVAYGDAFAYLYNCKYYEPCTLANGEPAVSFYQACSRGFATDSIADEVLRTSRDANTSYAYRIGYCPVEVYGDHAIAITLLNPGMNGTPEVSAVDRNWDRLTTDEKKVWRARNESLTYTQIVAEGNFELLRLMHRCGVPQVIPMQRYSVIWDYD